MTSFDYDTCRALSAKVHAHEGFAQDSASYTGLTEPCRHERTRVVVFPGHNFEQCLDCASINDPNRGDV